MTVTREHEAPHQVAPATPRAAAPTASPATASRAAVTVSVVVPTRHEGANVGQLVERVEAALRHSVPFEVLFVDDSDDETPLRISELVAAGRPVRLHHRPVGARDAGLSGAVLAGYARARGDVLVVMDGDLQHPPEALPRLLEPVLSGQADVAIASRYCAGGGDTVGLAGPWRRGVSQGSRRVVRLLLPRTRAVADPLGGFFVLRRAVVEGVDLQPEGFKILLEVLVRGHWARVVEVPYTFAPRVAGSSKAQLAEGVRFGRHLGRLVGVGPSQRPPERPDVIVLPV